MKVIGISLSNFRSIGNESVTLNPIKKINLVIGQNNAGKSNFIKAIETIKKNFKASNPFTISKSPLDSHQLDAKNTFQFTIFIDPSDVLEEFGIDIDEHRTYWFKYQVQSNNNTVQILDSFLQSLNYELKLQVFTKRTGRYYTSRPREDQLTNDMRDIATKCLPELINVMPSIQVIPQFRQILPGDRYGLDGKRIIEMLREFQHPVIGKEQDRDKFFQDTIINAAFTSFTGSKFRETADRRYNSD